MTQEKTVQAAPDRATITIWAKPSRHEITQWANSALRNSEIDYIDEALIEDFADGLPALRADLAAPSAPASERCWSCGAFGRKCYGNGPEGPDCDEWIGETDGRACCYACYESAPAPAEVEGLVERLSNAGHGGSIVPNPRLCREAATALTAQQAKIDRQRVTAEFWENCAFLSEKRAEKAEAERDELIAAIGDWARPTGANGMTTPSEHHPLMVARAKLKGDV